jgi:D-alanine-D-alanine ligase
LEWAAPDVVFNRVDSLGGSDALMAAATILLDALGLPYTGCQTAAIVAVTSKIAAKEKLLAAGLPTPPWINQAGDVASAQVNALPPEADVKNTRFILKSVYEHGSFQIEDASLLAPARSVEVAAKLREYAEQSERPFFAEQFIDGREFNLSMWGTEPEVLPPAEIDFSTFPVDKPRVVGHLAKWDPASFEYHQTVRRFDFPSEDNALLSRLKGLAVSCWRLFELRGYARIDFRIDAAGQPWILEINVNPSLSPTSGFTAALQEAGIQYQIGMQRILDNAIAQSRDAQPSLLSGSSLEQLCPHDDWHGADKHETP